MSTNNPPPFDQKVKIRDFEDDELRNFICSRSWRGHAQYINEKYIREHAGSSDEPPKVSFSSIRRLCTGESPIEYRTAKLICPFIWEQKWNPERWEDFLVPVEEFSKNLERHLPEPPLPSSEDNQTLSQFPSYVLKKLEDFVGREHVFKKIDTFIQNNDRGFFTLFGDPGEGKSTIAAKYIQKNPECVFFLNRYNPGINTAAEFLESICWQLINKYDLAVESLPDRATGSFVFVERLLQEISRTKLSDSEKLCIVVDGLDEVDLSQQRSGNVLYLPDSLEKHIYFVLTSRRKDELKGRLSFNQPAKKYDLAEDKDDCDDDIRAYLSLVLKAEHRFSSGLKAWIQRQPDRLSEADFKSFMVKKSKRNFMYLTLVIAELARPDGMYQNAGFESLPDSLKKYYHQHWARMGMRKEDPRRSQVKEDILQLFAYAQTPTSISMMLEYARCGIEPVTRQDVKDVVNGWYQFLHEMDIEDISHFQIYHTSYNDFLREEHLERPEGAYHAMFIKTFGKIYDDLTDDDDDEIVDD